MEVQSRRKRTTAGYNYETQQEKKKPEKPINYSSVLKAKTAGLGRAVKYVFLIKYTEYITQYRLIHQTQQPRRRTKQFVTDG